MEAKKARKKIAILLLCFLALCIQTQCSPKSQLIKEEEEVVLRKRVEEFWSYRIKGEWDKCYLYESPDLKAKINLIRYINQYSRNPVKWEGFEIQEIWASADEGNVKLNAKYRYLIEQTKKARFARVSEEKWIKKEGHWYRNSPMR